MDNYILYIYIYKLLCDALKLFLYGFYQLH